MIGNDIVDLRLAKHESNWQRKGWLQKLFTPTEQYHILKAKIPEFLVWEYWSRKEATYKAHQRRFSLAPKYNPKDYECIENTVRVGENTYRTQTKSTRYWIYSTSSSLVTKHTSKVFTNHLFAKTKLIDFVSKDLSIDSIKVSVFKDDNQIPHLSIEDKPKDFSFSLTNHGSFSAFIIDL